jgi:hypothetical protein
VQGENKGVEIQDLNFPFSASAARNTPGGAQKGSIETSWTIVNQSD